MVDSTLLRSFSNVWCMSKATPGLGTSVCYLPMKHHYTVTIVSYFLFAESESSDTHDGERTGRKCLVRSHRTAEPGVPPVNLIGLSK